ncbi:MAG TPA: A24 family peptidase [Chloroflexota bacterium]
MVFLWALVGLFAGSALNLLIHRLLRMEKLSEPVATFKPPEPRPLHRQSALLYLMSTLAGRRDEAASWPGAIALGVELSTAAAFGLLWLRFGQDTRTLLASAYACVMVVIFVIDWQRHLIYRIVVLPVTLLSLLLTPLVFQTPAYSSILGLLTGGFFFGMVFFLGLLIFRVEAIGWGDVELSLMLGAMLGFPAIVAAMLVTSLFGGVASVALLARRRSMRSYMPYGTAMCLGAFTTILLNGSLF